MITLPEEFKKNMGEILEAGEIELLLKSYEESSIKSLRINDLKKRAGDSADMTERFGLEKMPYSDCGYYFDESMQPGRSPYHDAGAYYIQDPGAMIPALVLLRSSFFKPEDDMKILDLCAAPGGKSTQIACRMRGRGILVSNEINRQRAEILSSNIERMGIENAIVINESPEKLAGFFAGYFDAVIVDAPCSGEGMFRKDPSAIDEWSQDNVDMCAKRQLSILESAYEMLRPGGALIYSTCTFEKTENEDVVCSFISVHPDMKMHAQDDLKNDIPGIRDGIGSCKGAFRAWPMYFKGEGQFASMMVKEGDGISANPLKGYAASSTLKYKKILADFLNDTLSDEVKNKILGAADRYRLFGDNLYIMPENAPDLSGLKVLRNGLHLGTFKKDRFEPAHALALALSESDVKCVRRCDEAEAESFVHGMTLEGEGKGWCLVTIGGYSLGWGKASGGKIKNHYPKGLRIL